MWLFCTVITAHNRLFTEKWSMTHQEMYLKGFLTVYQMQHMHRNLCSDIHATVSY